jgi:pimeloyl-ACP methyl ester carboxylesterase
VISVVTVHGLWMRGASMAVLRRRLAPRGLEVSEFDYPSVTSSLTANARLLAEYVDSLHCERVHLVGHSLGGVLIRAMLEQRVPANLGRIVCLGSPLRGSVTAVRLARWPGGARFVGRCLTEHCSSGGFDAWPIGVEAGSIAGNLPFGVGRLLGPFPEPNDGTVAVAETKVAGLSDHVVLRVSHMALLWSTHVAEQVEHFLAQGRFRR